MTDIQKFCKFFHELSNEENEFGSQSWNSWIQLPQTKHFFDFILKTRLITMKEVMDLRSENILSEHSYLRGRFDGLGDLVELISKLTSNKKEEI